MSTTEIRRRIAEAREKGASAERHCREIMREVACEISAMRQCCTHDEVSLDTSQVGTRYTCVVCGEELGANW